jgi:outer membrane protein assembly factor BamB
MGWKENKDRVCCLEASSGKKLWEVSYRCPEYGRHHKGDEGAYSGPTATPEFDSKTGYLYTLSNDGDLNCLDTHKQGRRVWTTNLYATYGVPRRPEVGSGGIHRDYGYITAPLVYGDWLIVEVGAKEGNLMAFDKKNGKRKWFSECKDPAGHCGGLTPMTVQGVPCIAVLTLRNLVVVRLDSGKEGRTVVRYEWITDGGQNIATPAVHENYVLITSEYNHKSICKLKITLDGATKLWEKPTASGACSPVIYKGHVYWAWQRLHCLDFATGEQKWQGGSFGSAGSCIATADDRLVVWGDHGKLVLAETADRSAKKYKELARVVRLSSTQVWPHVVLSEGRLFCKDRDGTVKCFNLRTTRP